MQGTSNKAMIITIIITVVLIVLACVVVNALRGPSAGGSGSLASGLEGTLELFGG